jgi:branched-chain amino acid transport system permease protein
MIQVFINSLVSASVYFMVGTGVSIIYTSAGFLHFSHGVVIAIGAYTTYILRVSTGLPFSVSIVGGVLASVVAGLAIELSVYGPLRRRGGTPITLLLASIGVSIVLQSLLTIGFGSGSRSFRGGIALIGWSLGGIRVGPSLGGIRVGPSQVFIVATGVCAFGALWLLLHGMKVGVRLRAVMSEPELAEVYGVNRQALILFAFLVGSALAGVAGVLLAMDTDLTPNIGFDPFLMGMSAAVIGGISSIRGAGAGAIFLGLLQHFGAWFISSRWQYAVTFLIVILFLAVRPQGFLGTPLKKTAV